MWVRRGEFQRVLDAQHPISRGHGTDQRVQQSRLARPGSADDKEGETCGDHRFEHLDQLGRDRLRRDQSRHIHSGRAQYPQRDTCTVRGERRDDRVEPHGEPASAERRELGVDPRLRVVETSTGAESQPTSESSDGRIVVEGDTSRFETTAAIDPDPLRSDDEHVGDTGLGEQYLESARAGQFGLQMPQCRKQIGVAENTTRLRANRLRDDRCRRFGRLLGEALTHPVDQSVVG